MIKAECTWGDGPDVLLVIKDKEHHLLLDLTKEKALALSHSLLTAVSQVIALEDLCVQHDQAVEKKF